MRKTGIGECFGLTFFSLVVEDCGLGDGINDRGVSRANCDRFRIAIWSEKNAIDPYRNRNCDRTVRPRSSRNRTGWNDRTLRQLGTLESLVVGTCSSRTHIPLSLECGTDSNSALGTIAARRREFSSVFGARLGVDYGLGSGAEISITGAVDQRSRSTIV